MGGSPVSGGLAATGFSEWSRRFNVVAVFVPFVAFGVAVATLWNGLVGPVDLVLLGVGYFLTTLGIAMGYHRLLVHRSFETKPWIRGTLAVLGSMAVEGPPVTWVADHRKHHTFADEEGDPHSPHTHGGPGWRGTIRGLYHAHFGWLISRQESSDPLRYARDLVRDPMIMRINRGFPAIVLAGLLIPAGIGFAAAGTVHGALTGLLWGGLVRIFFVHHMTWSVNSLGHYYGRRRFAIRDKSSNIPLLALLSLGDSWHHNHHAFPRSASHGLRRWELDPIGWIVAGMERVGLAWNVVRVSPEQQREKELGRARGEVVAA